MRELVCCWCGASGGPEDFELDTQYEKGFWCPDCDGFTFYDEKDQEAHRMLLLLEQGGAGYEPGPGVPTGLRKRLSPLRYPGGKSKLIDFIYQRLQGNQMDTFVEVFAGGASLGLSLLDAGKVNRLVLNDLDPAVYSFWYTVLNHPDFLREKLDGDRPTLQDFWESKQYLNYADTLVGEHSGRLSLAWSFLLLNRTCFSGIVMANPMGGKKGGESYLSRWNPSALGKRIRRIADLAPKIEICRMDCCELVEDIAYWYPSATLFVDPPYYEKGHALYPTAFTKGDHERLAATLNALYTGMPGPDIVITYDDHPEIRKLYPYAQVEEVKRAYSIAN